MTIGIAASGDGAGEAILLGLRAVEAIGIGAIGGFVSLAVIAEGKLRRAETQTGGSTMLFGGADWPGWLRDAERAVLMSSGPDRPNPLAQFTPGDAGVGLVTGHRFPNSLGPAGHPLNVEALALMAAGSSPQSAIDRVLDTSPDADAGMIALGADGQMGMADSRYLDRFGDRGATLLGDGGHNRVAILHNAILPYRGLALIAAETALDIMVRRRTDSFWVRLAAGVRLGQGAANLVETAAANAPAKVVVSDPALLTGERSFGLGFRVPVRGEPHPAWLAYEPYLVVRDGVLQSIDGKAEQLVEARFLTR